MRHRLITIAAALFAIGWACITLSILIGACASILR